ncbi:hypothetical protein [Sinomonas halotolerans]|uniref:Polysaccharide biosynthesis protein n=1 Tax=Sinomonas halotolerans TaxID=1644133 RepID=A0ABU9WYN2_9MICC
MEEYGFWLMVSTTQAYLALSDFGMVSAAGSRMTVLLARGASIGANRVFHVAILFVAIVSAAIGVLAPAIALIFHLIGVPRDFALAGGVLAIGVAASLLGGLSFAVLQATHRNHIGVATTTNIRLAEWFGGVAGLLLTGSPVAVACGMLAARLLTTIFVFVRAIASQKTFTVSFRGWKLLRFHLGTSISNFLISLSSSLSIQGLTLIVGLFYGPSEVSLYNTYRTAARVAVQTSATFSHAVWPEFGILFGRRDGPRLRMLFWRTFNTSLVLALFAGLGMIAVLPNVLTFWTHGKVPMVYPIAIGFALYALAASVWHLPRVLLTAVGKNRDVAYCAVAISLATVFAAVVIGYLAGPLLSQIAAAVVFEAALAVAVAGLAVRWLRRSIG